MVSNFQFIVMNERAHECTAPGEKVTSGIRHLSCLSGVQYQIRYLICMVEPSPLAVPNISCMINYGLMSPKFDDTVFWCVKLVANAMNVLQQVSVSECMQFLSQAFDINAHGIR